MRWVGHVAYVKGNEHCINSGWKILQTNQGVGWGDKIKMYVKSYTGRL